MSILRYQLFVSVCLVALAGCGPAAPLASKNAKWFDFTDADNAKPLGPGVSASALAKIESVKLDLGGNPAIADSDLEAISDCKNLVMLDAYLTGITDNAMDSLVGVPLEVLVVSQTQIGDEGLATIGKIKTLRRLELFDTKVTDAGLKHLANLPLFRIDLSKTAVTDAGMEDIAKIKGLERLIVSNTTVSDVGLATIGKIHTLTELNVENAGEITDVGLQHLHELKSLKALFLGDSKYSAEGLKELKRALPNCEISAND
jgi:Leucine Rich repeat